MKIRFVLVIAFLSALMQSGWTQVRDPFLDKLKESITDYYQRTPHDNIYLHTDRYIYTAGENLFFRAFISDAVTLEPSVRSETVHLVLTDVSGRELITNDFVNQGGSVSGNMILPDNLESGLYYLLGLTSADGAYSTLKPAKKELFILSPEQEFALSYQFDAESYSEGESFELTLSVFGNSGRPVRRAGINYEIVSGGEATLVGNERTAKDGRISILGSIPGERSGISGISITAEKRGNNLEYFIPFPMAKKLKGQKADPDAHPVRIDITGYSSERLEIASDYDSEILADTTRILVVLLRKGMIYWSARGKLAQARELSIPIRRVPGGILSVVLFDHTGKLLAERLAYVDKADGPGLEIALDRPSYGSRDLVKSEIRLTGAGSESLVAQVSVSVIPEDVYLATYPTISEFMHVVADVEGGSSDRLIMELREGDGSAEVNSLLKGMRRNGYRWERILAEDDGVEQVGMKELSERINEEIAATSRELHILPPYVRSERLLDLSSGIIDNRVPGDGKESYIRLLESGMDIIDVINSIKSCRLDGNKIIFAGGNNSINYQQGALIVINNQLMGEDASILETLSPQEIKSIRISTDPVDIHRYSAFNVVGVIDITLKGTEMESRMDETSERDRLIGRSGGTYIPGYPDYRLEKDMKSIMNDFRPLLYWEPDRRIEGAFSGSIEFFTSDIPGSYVIVVNGFAGNIPVSSIRRFEVIR